MHSYYFECEDINNILAHTNYGIDFASIVSKENIYGVQFHPEKSSNQGLNLNKEFYTNMSILLKESIKINVENIRKKFLI